MVTSENRLQEPQIQAARSALLLAVARYILESSDSGGRLAEEVFARVREHIEAGILLAHRLEPDGSLRLVGHAGIPDALYDAATRRRFAQILCSRVAEQREPLVVTDALEECTANEPAACFLREVGLRAYVCHPLLGRGDAVLGTLAVARPANRGFDPAEVEFMQTVSHFIALAWDRQRTEQEHGRRERELATLVDNAPCILTRHDRQLRYLLVNTRFEETSGLGRAQVLGRVMCETGLLPMACQAWEAAIRKVFEQGRPVEAEFGFDTPEGRRAFEGRLVPEFSPEGAVESVLSVIQDRTGEKLAQQALREAALRKDEFLATLAHELRNPLAPVRTGLQILRLSPSESTAAEKALGTMERQVSHMVRLIDDLLDVSRISRGKLELRRERLTLRPVIDSAVEASRPLIDAGRHDLRLHLPVEPLYLDADAIRLAQVVSNLLNNAAKYTPEGGRIDLSVEREDHEAVIRVQDNGVGLAREALPEVFEMFTQVGRTLERAQGGLGIGLSIVKRLVEMHGGTIRADSPGPGQGSVFTVRLPLAPEPPGLAVASAAADAPQAPGRKVLVVDDNADAADTLAAMLGLLGHRARAAYGGPEALAAAGEFGPEIVFCDIGMPGMNGYEVARALRRDPAQARTLLVALTGWGSEDDKRQARDAGFDVHLTKPVDAGAVQALLNRDGAQEAGEALARPLPP